MNYRKDFPMLEKDIVYFYCLRIDYRMRQWTEQKGSQRTS